MRPSPAVFSLHFVVRQPDSGAFLHYILYSLARNLQAVVFFAGFWRFGPNSSLLWFRIVELLPRNRRFEALLQRFSSPRSIIYKSYYLFRIIRFVVFQLFSAVCAADKWRFFTEKFSRPLFPVPVKWRFFTGKTGKFSFFLLSPPRFGACTARTAGNFRASCRFFS